VLIIPLIKGDREPSPVSLIILSWMRQIIE